MSFDARTLLILGGFLCWILAAVIEFQVARPADRRVLPDAWTLALLAKGAGLNLISQRGLIADAWTISLAHALLLASVLLSYIALQRIRGAETSRVLLAIMPVSLALLLPLVGFSQDAFQTRVAIVMMAWTFGFVLNCWSAGQAFRAGHRIGASMILGSYVIIAVFAIIFANGVLAREVPGVFGGNGALLAFYGISNVCILLGTFGYMEIVRRLHDRQSQGDETAQPDGLTGLCSARTFSKIGTAQLHRAALSGRTICVMEARIDGLEGYQASQGQASADLELKRAASVVLDQIRVYDFAGRISATSIGVVMPDSGLQASVEVAERIVKGFSADAPVGSDGPRLTLSVGVCSSRGDDRHFDGVMAMVGDCVAKAQAEGGNRVIAIALGHPVDRLKAEPGPVDERPAAGFQNSFPV